MGLHADENYLVFRWNGTGKVLFSVAQRGDALVCHFASNKEGLKHLKEACSEFVNFCFFCFPWCKMLMTDINKQSVARMVEKIGFVPVAQTTNGQLYVRER